MTEKHNVPDFKFSENGDVTLSPEVAAELAVDVVASMKAELQWLRFFYKNAKHSMGPADSDIYRSIAREWKRDGNTLPEEYEEYLFGE
jgi:hypothetical protein